MNKEQQRHDVAELIWVMSYRGLVTSVLCPLGLATCACDSVILPTYTFEVRRPVLNLSVAMPRQNCEEALKNFELFIYGDIHYSVH